MRKVIFLLSIIFCFFAQTHAKDQSYFPEVDSIKQYFIQIEKTRNEDKKVEINDKLISYFITFLEKPESFNASFDSIADYVSVLRSDDKLLNIFTWNLYFDDGSFKYFGFLQYKAKDKLKVYFLNDKKYKSEEEDEDIVRRYMSNMEWYGAIYYELITKKWQSKTYYTLIGWDGADFLINRKIIEVLQFDRHDLPIFGGKVFKLTKTNANKLIFEYADKTTMLLRYNPKHDMIVLDHLAPPDDKYQGMPQYYGPDFSYDGFIFKNGKWIFQENIDASIAINYKKDKKINQMKQRGFNSDF